MASSEVLDFARLLAPIRAESPVGRALRTDFSANSVYYQIKDARGAARSAERSIAFEEERQSSAADWKPVLELGPRVLAEESKDLEIAAWLTEALVRQHGYAGLRDGFRLLRELIERFWDDIYPRPDEDGIHGRLAALAGLNGEGSDGVLIGPILNVPITASGNGRALSYADYQQAIDLDRISDPDKRAQRIDQGTISSQLFDQAVLDTSDAVLRDHFDDIGACQQEFDRLCAVLDEKCGVDENGHSLAPPCSNIRNALASCHELLQRLCQARLPAGEGSSAAVDGKGIDGSAVEMPGGTTPLRRPGGQLQSREEAFQLLLQMAEFFKRTEPHSPVSYALQQSVRWGKMPLPDLLSELVPEEAVRTQIFRLVGIVPSEKPK
jgi:type VI secretion system protein ImpA